MMDTGMRVRPEVLSTRNIIIGLVAVARSVAFSLSLTCIVAIFSSFSCCICSIAFRPRGVAALSRPSILAAMFINMLPVTGCPLGMSGNKRVKMGVSRRAITFTTPPFSPIFIMPSHNDRTPVSPKEISKAVLEESKVEFIMAGKTSTSPRKMRRKSPMTKAIRKNATKM